MTVSKPYLFLSKTNDFPPVTTNLIEYNFDISNSSNSSTYYEDYLYLYAGNLKGEKVRLLIENENLPGSSLYISKLDNSLNVLGWEKKIDFDILTDDEIFVFKYRYEVINNKFIIQNYLEQTSFLNCYLVTDRENIDFAIILDKPDIGTDNIIINEGETKYFNILNYNSLYNYKAYTDNPLLYVELDGSLLKLKSPNNIIDDIECNLFISVYDNINFPNMLDVHIRIIKNIFYYDSNDINNDDSNNVSYVVESYLTDDIYDSNDINNDDSNNIEEV